MKKNKPFVVYMADNTKQSSKTATYEGHIVHCKDLDSCTEFNVEVNVLSTLDESRKIEVAIDAAKKTEPVAMLAGNTIEYEYVQPSGRAVEIEEYKFRTELSPRTEESEQLLEQMHLE